MWYAANLLFKSVHSIASDDEPLWEESIYLIDADSKEAATLKAEIIGRSAEVSYSMHHGDSIRWTFFKVERIHEIEEQIEDGVEIFSRFLRDSEVKSILTPFEE